MNSELCVMVSVICNTYNHAPYIAQTLDGFLIQKTNFAFEILVHDDASTDGTADIIREYERKYPDIIKPIYQTENQYSKGVNISQTYQYSRAKGKYIAFCEGDDYWTNPLKLQKQYDAMEQHPELDICAHAAVVIYATTGKRAFDIAPKNKDVIISPEEVIAGGGEYVATNTLFYRSSLQDNIPSFRVALTLDYTLQIHGSLRGGLLYLKDFMSVYRYLTPGSWTVTQQGSIDKRTDSYKRKQKMLNQLNIDTNSIYATAINKRMLLNELNHLESIGDYKHMFTTKYRHIYRELPLKRKFKIHIKAMFSGIVSIIRSFKKHIRDKHSKAGTHS